MVSGDDVLIVGGGVIGLSLAYELAGHGLRVRVVDRGAVGSEASWAGAGIIPAARRRPHLAAPLELAALSAELHPAWAQQLREETGIDNGYRCSGGIYLACDEDQTARLALARQRWTLTGVPAEPLDDRALAACEPALAAVAGGGRLRAAWYVPDEAQVRNPRHLRALSAACQRRGAAIVEGVEITDFRRQGSRIVAARGPDAELPAGAVCITSGCWSAPLAERLGLRLPVRPIRGQIVLLKCPRPPLAHIVNEEPRYLVPRDDGRVLVGSTEEDVGFDRRTTAEGIEGLLGLARRLAPALGRAEVERSWAGLRPGTPSGLPWIGRIPGWDNAYLAAGHFRSGLTLSTGTAVVLGQLIRQATPEVELAAFQANASVLV